MSQYVLDTVTSGYPCYVTRSAISGWLLGEIISASSPQLPRPAACSARHTTCLQLLRSPVDADSVADRQCHGTINKAHKLILIWNDDLSKRGGLHRIVKSEDHNSSFFRVMNLVQADAEVGRRTVLVTLAPYSLTPPWPFRSSGWPTFPRTLYIEIDDLIVEDEATRFLRNVELNFWPWKMETLGSFETSKLTSWLYNIKTLGSFET
jgi:hypothetical protein